MEQVHVIRHKVLMEGRLIRSVAREMGVSRNTVNKYLHQAEPTRKESQERRRPVFSLVAPRIDELLEEWGHGQPVSSGSPEAGSTGSCSRKATR